MGRRIEPSAFRLRAGAAGLWWTSAYVLLLVALVAESPTRSVGDGREYLLYATSLARGHGVTLEPAVVESLGAELAQPDGEFRVHPLESWTYKGPDGRVEFIHFWFYAAVATPLVALAESAGVDPRFGFTALNVLLLSVAFTVVYRHLGWVPAVLLGAGPTLWWSDKAHPEVWLFSLTAIAFAMWRTRPEVTMVASGLLAAQVPPFAVLVLLFAAAALARRFPSGRPRGLWAAIALALVLTALPPLWYLWRFGRLTLLAGGGWSHWAWPSVGELVTPLFDLNIGLIPNHPLLGLALVGAVGIGAWNWRQLARIEIVIALTGVVALLFAFPQVRNWTHGGTPGISRFGVWLIPFAVPLLRVGLDRGWWRWLFGAVALGSALYCVKFYAPAVPEYGHRVRPTWAARQLWRHQPSWSRPLPIVFATLMKPTETTLPVASPECTKLLLVGRGEAQGMWPRPCVPAEVPAECRRPATLCWANASHTGYRFARAGDERLPFPYDPGSVWPKRAEAAISARLSELDWRSADWDVKRSFVRAVHGARLDGGFVGESASLLVISEAVSDVIVVLRLEQAVTGELIDGDSGAALGSLTPEQPTFGTLLFRVPRHRLVALVLTPSAR